MVDHVSRFREGRATLTPRITIGLAVYSGMLCLVADNATTDVLPGPVIGRGSGIGVRSAVMGATVSYFIDAGNSRRSNWSPEVRHATAQLRGARRDRA
jgi:hypothetical protein